MSAGSRMCNLISAIITAAAVPTLTCSALAQHSKAEERSGASQSQAVQPAHPSDVDAKVKANGGLLITPLVKIIPGNVKPPHGMENPMAQYADSARRGMKYFNGFNCVGCHGPNGGGAIAPQLAHKAFKFGRRPAQHYLVISHGEPLGMPAWGSILPNNVIWDIISYIDSISNEPSHSWGETINPAINEPAIQEMPYEFVKTTNPWQHTMPFKYGKKPTAHPFDAAQNVTDLPD